MWGSARGRVDDNSTQAALREKAVEIDPLQPRGSNNGTLVLAAGRIVSHQNLEDELLKPGAYLILRRRVEMFQWVEEAQPVGGTSEYRLAWRDGQVDFFKFKNPTGHENPLLRFEGVTKGVEASSFGAFDGSGLLRSVTVLLPLQLSSDMLKDASLKIEDNKLYLPRGNSVGVGAQLGDMRVSYEVLPQGDYTVLTVQRDERNLVGAQPAEGLVIRAGLLTTDSFFQAERADLGQISTGFLYLGGVVFFFGLCSLLTPLASSISLKPKIDISGMPAVIAISAGISVMAVCIFFIMGQF